MGSHFIPDRPAVLIPTCIPHVPSGCSVGLEDARRLSRVVELAVSTVYEGSQKSVLAVNTSGGLMILKQVVFLTQVLVYDQRILFWALDSPASCVASLHKSAAGIEPGTYMEQGPGLS